MFQGACVLRAAAEKATNAVAETPKTTQPRGVTSLALIPQPRNCPWPVWTGRGSQYSHASRTTLRVVSCSVHVKTHDESVPVAFLEGGGLLEIPRTDEAARHFLYKLFVESSSSSSSGSAVTMPTDWRPPADFLIRQPETLLISFTFTGSWRKSDGCVKVTQSLSASPVELASVHEPHDSRASGSDVVVVYCGTLQLHDNENRRHCSDLAALSSSFPFPLARVQPVLPYPHMTMRLHCDNSSLLLLFSSQTGGVSTNNVWHSDFLSSRISVAEMKRAKQWQDEALLSSRNNELQSRSHLSQHDYCLQVAGWKHALDTERQMTASRRLLEECALADALSRCRQLAEDNAELRQASTLANRQRDEVVSSCQSERQRQLQMLESERQRVRVVQEQLDLVTTTHALLQEKCVVDTTQRVVCAHRYAIICCNSTYEHHAKLPGCDADAKGMLASFKAMGYNQVFNLHNYLGERLRGALTSIGQFIKNRAAKGNTDVVWFHFSGHGSQCAGTTYLLPVDHHQSQKTQKDLEEHALSLRSLVGLLKSNRCDQRTILTIDACRSRGVRGGRASQLEGSEADLGAVCVAFGTSGGSEATEHEQQGGNFTSALLYALQEPDVAQQPVITLLNKLHLQESIASHPIQQHVAFSRVGGGWQNITVGVPPLSGVNQSAFKKQRTN